MSSDQVEEARGRLRAAQCRILNLRQRASTLVCDKLHVSTKLHDLRSKCAELLQQKRDAQQDIGRLSERRDMLSKFYAEQRQQMTTFEKKETLFWRDEESAVSALSENVTKFLSQLFDFKDTIGSVDNADIADFLGEQLTIEHEDLTDSAMTFSESTAVANIEAEIRNRQAILHSLEEQIMVQKETCTKIIAEAEESRKYQEARKEEVTTLLQKRLEQMQVLNAENQRLEAQVMDAMRRRDEKRRELQQLEDSSNKAGKGKRGVRSRK